MQCTGQISTQALSFTPTQGSQITYAIARSSSPRVAPLRQAWEFGNAALDTLRWRPSPWCDLASPAGGAPFLSIVSYRSPPVTIFRRLADPPIRPLPAGLE